MDRGVHMADEAPTPTIFRRYPDGEVVALFPTIPADPQGHCLSYLHVGQHGAADPSHVIDHTRPARPDEYADLMDELIRIGYVVRPIRRLTRRMVEERRATLARWLG
jgi:hypothetical protein